MVLVTTWKENEETQYLETRVRKSFCTLVLWFNFNFDFRGMHEEGKKWWLEISSSILQDY